MGEGQGSGCQADGSYIWSSSRGVEGLACADGQHALISGKGAQPTSSQWRPPVCRDDDQFTAFDGPGGTRHVAVRCCADRDGKKRPRLPTNHDNFGIFHRVPPD